MGVRVEHPETEEEVASVLVEATAVGSFVQVVGGGSHSGFGDPPDPDVVLDVTGIAGIIAWEPDDMTVVVAAGSRVSEVEAELNARGQTMVMPEHPGPATVGGVVAAGASSLRRGRMLGTRERVLEARVVTGDGRVVRSGGRVVKNVTGYDLTRLHVGAFGSLGVIVSVCLRLWPIPAAGATVTVPAAEAAGTIGRPLAILQDRSATTVFVTGTEREVESAVSRLGGESVPGLIWPEDPEGEFRWSIRIPPGLVGEVLEQIPETWQYLALHGVGEVRAGSTDSNGARELRAWCETRGGHLVSVARSSGATDLDPWGTAPETMELQKALIRQFDPARVINPGRLPGGI